MHRQVQLNLIDAIPDPVLLLATNRRIVAANAAARDLLGQQIEDRNLSHVLRHPAALAAANSVLGGEPAPMVAITLPVPVRQDYEVHVSPLPNNQGAAAALMVLRDVTMLRGAEQMRSDFVANVSHELRSPLSSLIAIIETLQRSARDDKKARAKFLGIMEDESQRMTRIIDDLLSLSKVEANEHIPPDDPVDMDGLLQRVVGTLTTRAQDGGTTLNLSVEDDLPQVFGNADQLTAVFHNLVDNAIKYGRENTAVDVSAEAVERIPDVGRRGVLVVVRDQGEGIAAEHLPRLTERFYRVDKGRSRSMGGTGLGLAIAKHIVNRHRGRLVVDSTIGIGSSFKVFLPAAERARAAGTPFTSLTEGDPEAGAESGPEAGPEARP